jgi:hypothetical protein
MNTVPKRLAVGLTALVIAATAAGCGAAEAKDSTNGSGTFEAKGIIEDMTIRSGSACNSQNHGVLKTGDEVKIQANGRTVAMGEVGTATFEDRSATGNGYVCNFSFAVSDVPSGEKFYTVVIENQGEKEVTADELTSGRVRLVSHELDNEPS